MNVEKTFSIYACRSLFCRFLSKGLHVAGAMYDILAYFARIYLAERSFVNNDIR
jgi:hypothetical protein